MANNLEDEFGTRPATDEERIAWEAGNMHGVRAQFTGVRVDSRGNRMNELTVIDDEFEMPKVAQGPQHAATCACLDCQRRSFNYLNWHQQKHRHIPDTRCTICQAEQKFKQEHPDLIGKRVGWQP